GHAGRAPPVRGDIRGGLGGPGAASRAAPVCVPSWRGWARGARRKASLSDAGHVWEGLNAGRGPEPYTKYTKSRLSIFPPKEARSLRRNIEVRDFVTFVYCRSSRHSR